MPAADFFFADRNGLACCESLTDFRANHSQNLLHAIESLLRETLTLRGRNMIILSILFVLTARLLHKWQCTDTV